MVGLSFSVCTVYDLGINTDRGNTIVQWSTEQFIDSLVLTINAGYGAVIFDANGSITTVCISKSDNEIGQSFRVNSCAFTVKKLRFSMEAQFYYIIRVNHVVTSFFHIFSPDRRVLFSLSSARILSSSFFIICHPGRCNKVRKFEGRGRQGIRNHRRQRRRMAYRPYTQLFLIIPLLLIDSH